MREGCCFSVLDARSDEFLLGSFLRFDLVGRAGLKPLDERAELEGEKLVRTTDASQQVEERLGADKDGLRLAVNRQDITDRIIFQRLQDLRKVAVEFAAANVTNARLRHLHPLWAMCGLNGNRDAQTVRLFDDVRSL